MRTNRERFPSIEDDCLPSLAPARVFSQSPAKLRKDFTRSRFLWVIFIDGLLDFPRLMLTAAAAGVSKGSKTVSSDGVASAIFAFGRRRRRHGRGIGRRRRGSRGIYRYRRMIRVGFVTGKDRGVGHRDRCGRGRWRGGRGQIRIRDRRRCHSADRWELAVARRDV